MFECAGCGAASEDGFKPCGCITMIGINEDHQQVVFLDPAKRDALAQIVCRYLTGQPVSANGAFDNWLCPVDDESANNMCAEIAEKIMRASALTGLVLEGGK